MNIVIFTSTNSLWSKHDFDVMILWSKLQCNNIKCIHSQKERLAVQRHTLQHTILEYIIYILHNSQLRYFSFSLCVQFIYQTASSGHYYHYHNSITSFTTTIYKLCDIYYLVPNNVNLSCSNKKKVVVVVVIIMIAQTSLFRLSSRTKTC